MTSAAEQSESKVPAVTLGFWIIKIAATTLGETGGDTVTMTMVGYLTGTAIFLAMLAVLVRDQVAAKKFHPFLYWATIVASTTAGTTLADFADRSLGIGYAGGSSMLLAGVLASLGVWYWVLGTISVDTVSTPKTEAFYWTTITLSQTLGTALGDWTADNSGLGYIGGATLFVVALAMVAGAYYTTSDLARAFILGRIHPDASAWRHRRRFPRQAAGRGRSRGQPADRDCDHRRLHRRLPSAAAAEGRKASEPICMIGLQGEFHVQAASWGMIQKWKPVFRKDHAPGKC